MEIPRSSPATSMIPRSTARSVRRLQFRWKASRALPQYLRCTVPDKTPSPRMISKLSRRSGRNWAGLSRRPGNPRLPAPPQDNSEDKHSRCADAFTLPFSRPRREPDETLIDKGLRGIIHDAQTTSGRLEMIGSLTYVYYSP